MPQKYRSKPITFEAIQLKKENRGEILKWMGEHKYEDRSWDPVNIAIKNNHGLVVASPGDYVIRDSKGDFYPCNEEIFNEKYEAVKP